MIAYYTVVINDPVVHLAYTLSTVYHRFIVLGHVLHCMFILSSTIQLKKFFRGN